MPLQIIRQDITKMQVDAIVNTTNAEMVGYSGVDLAIHTIAGAGLDAECAKLAPLGLGEAKLTGAYALPCKYVIHTSGPVWRGGRIGESAILRSCYIECLKLAVENGCQTVAFPLISSGVYGYPKDQVLKFAVQTITEFLFEHELTVYICVFDKESYSLGQKLFRDIEEYIDDNYVRAHTERVYEHPLLRNMSERRSIHRDSDAVTLDACIREIADMLPEDDLGEKLKQIDESFSEMLLRKIDEKGMTDAACYKKANIDRKLFSKIRSDAHYKPSKPTVIAFAIALELSLSETEDMLRKAGFALSHSNKFDIIIEYFISKGNYNVFEINEALFAFDQSLLGG